jgi:hypothetical protein
MAVTEVRLTVALGAALKDPKEIEERARAALELAEGFSAVVVTVEVDEDERSAS